MSEADVDQVLKDLLLSEHAPELTDDMVDALMSLPIDSPAGSLDRMRARFAAKVLAESQQISIKETAERLPLGRWLEAVRNKVRLTRADIAAALGKSTDYVGAVEDGSAEPWCLSPEDLADWATLFRLHIGALAQMLSVSRAVNLGRARVGVAPRRSGKNAKAENEKLNLALDKHLASRSRGGGLDEEVARVVGLVREELGRRRLTDLLD